MSIFRLLAGLALAWCLALGPAVASAQVQDDTAQTLLQRLAEASNAEKSNVLKQIAESGDERARGWLEAFAGGRLATVKSSGYVVLVTSNTGRNWQVASAVTGDSIGEMSRRDLDSIRVNNALRSQVEGILSVVDLSVADHRARSAAARHLLGRVDTVMAPLIKERLEVEENSQVRDLLANALAIHLLEQGDINAIEQLSGSLNSRVRAALNNAASSDDPAIAAAAEKALASIEQKLKLNKAAETLYFGLSLGSVLVLAAIGLAITFGVMGVINMAHGELIMLGAYTTWGMQQLFPGQPGLALILSIPAGFMVAALAGIIIERSVIQHLKGRPLETLLATFGISLILQQLVRTVISR